MRLQVTAVLTEVDVLVADGLGQAGAGAGAAEPEGQVGGEEEGRPAGTEPTGEERSNKLRVKFYQFNGQSHDTSSHHPHISSFSYFNCPVIYVL